MIYAVKIDGRTRLVDSSQVIQITEEAAQQIIDIQDDGGDLHLVEADIAQVILKEMGA